MGYVTNIGGIEGLNGYPADNVHICSITPDLAEKILATNPDHNRHIKTKGVARIKADMQNGHYADLSPNLICIDTNGRLADGQHRLNGAIDADKTMLFYVMDGVKPDAVIDKGIPRTDIDSLKIRGQIADNMAKPQVRAIATLYITIRDGQRDNVTENDIGAFINENAHEIQMALRLSSLGKQHSLCNLASVQVAIVAALKNNVTEDVLEAFVRVANTGFPNSECDADKQSAAIVLRNYVTAKEYHARGGKARRIICAAAQMAIRDFANGAPRKRAYKPLIHCYITGKEETPLQRK